jgi:predicted Holliday junction resolvase-like endonuclease
MELLEFLVTVILILWVIRMVLRVAIPMLFQKVVNKAQQHQQSYQQQNYNRTSAKQGSIKIDHIPQQPKGKIPDSEGDFIDYEEVK